MRAQLRNAIYSLRRYARSLSRHWPALLLALYFAFAESLVCIIHCHVFVPSLLNQTGHLHQHTALSSSTHAGHNSAAADTIVVAAPTARPTELNCFHAAGGASRPELAPPPSPIHEVLLITAIVLVGIRRLSFLRSRAPPPPRQHATAPLLPPPRLSLG